MTDLWRDAAVSDTDAVLYQPRRVSHRLHGMESAVLMLLNSYISSSLQCLHYYNLQHFSSVFEYLEGHFTKSSSSWMLWCFHNTVVSTYSYRNYASASWCYW